MCSREYTITRFEVIDLHPIKSMVGRKPGDGKLVYKDQAKLLKAVLRQSYNRLHQSVILFVLLNNAIKLIEHNIILYFASNSLNTKERK